MYKNWIDRFQFLRTFAIFFFYVNSFTNNGWNEKIRYFKSSLCLVSSSSIEGWKEKIETLVEKSGRKLTWTQAEVGPNFGTVDFEK